LGKLFAQHLQIHLPKNSPFNGAMFKNFIIASVKRILLPRGKHIFKSLYEYKDASTTGQQVKKVLKERGKDKDTSTTGQQVKKVFKEREGEEEEDQSEVETFSEIPEDLQLIT
jgi:hypothetical protein